MSPEGRPGTGVSPAKKFLEKVSELRAQPPRSVALSLRALSIPAGLRIAVLAPHPDDFDAIAATMRFFQENGNPTEVGVLTSGASGVEDGFHGAITPEAKASVREMEQRASCISFGLEASRLVFLRLKEDAQGDPEDSDANFRIVSSYLDARRPDVVFLPHGNDPNPGHRRSFELYRRYADEHLLNAFLNCDPKTISMHYEFYLAFGAETAAFKAELLRCHDSQHRRNLNTRGYGFDERILRLNRRIASTLGIESEYAEAFELSRPDKAT